MNSLFDDLSTGLQEAIDFAKGTGKAKTVTYTICPVTPYSHSEVREIRMNAGMTQAVFADYMGVSVKTVESWECGRTHPTGPAYRLLGILASGEKIRLPFITAD